jgi:hypothetical protein
MLIAVASVKGAPGVTTLALGLTALWPGQGVVLVECDIDGGDLAARFGHHPDPGLTSLAAAARTGRTQVPLAEHAQRLSVGADVVLAPPGDGTAAAVQTLIYSGGELLRHAGRDRAVVVDLGRLARGGPGMALAAVADHLLIVTGADLADAAQVQARLAWLRPELSGRLWLVRAGGGGYRATELARDLGVPVIWDLPHSRLGAGALTGSLRVPNWRRLKLARAIRGVATILTTAQPASILPDVDPARPLRGRPVLEGRR